MAHLVSGNIEFKVIGSDKLVITEPCRVHVLGRDWDIEIGTTTDLASFPVIGYALYDPFEGALASVWHDVRYVLGDITRLEADRGWYLLAIAGDKPETKMPKWKAKIGYMGLRVGGWLPWRRHRKGQKEWSSSASGN